MLCIVYYTSNLYGIPLPADCYDMKKLPMQLQLQDFINPTGQKHLLARNSRLPKLLKVTPNKSKLQNVMMSWEHQCTIKGEPQI